MKPKKKHSQPKTALSRKMKPPVKKIIAKSNITHLINSFDKFLNKCTLTSPKTSYNLEVKFFVICTGLPNIVL